MPSALILINADSGSEEKVLEFIGKQRPPVDFAVRVYGSYNIIVKAAATTDDELKKIILNIRTFEFIRSTSSLLVRESS